MKTERSDSVYDIRTFVFQVSEALDGIRRTGVMNFSTVTTVAVSLAILGGFLLGLRNLNAILDRLQSSYEITVFLEPAAPQAGIQLLQQNLGVDPAVNRFRFVGRDEALESIARDLQAGGQVFPKLERNPLPDAFQILVREGTDFPAFKRRILGYPGVDEVSSGQDWVERALALVELARAVGLLLVLVLGGASLLIIANTIRLTVHSRREEIEIMQLVGATNWFIRVPFLIEGFLQGTAGALLALGLVFGSYHFLVGQIATIAPFLPLVTSAGELARLAAQILLMGMILGLLGALLSLRKILV